MARRTLMALLVGIAALAGACSSDAKISWIFVSNPSGGSGASGGAVIVIRYSSSSANATVGTRWITATGSDDAGPVDVHLAVGGEHAVLERPRELELRAPVVPAGAVRLPGAAADFVETGPVALRLRALDVHELDPRATGPGVVTVAAAGTLVLVDHAAGVLAFGAGAERYFPAGSSVEEIGDGLWVRTPDQRITRIDARPAPGTGERLRRPQAGRLELLGPRGSVIAALPEERVQLHGGERGLFLTASFPDGLDSRTPTTLTAADGNRFLLRIDSF